MRKSMLIIIVLCYIVLNTAALAKDSASLTQQANDILFTKRENPDTDNLFPTDVMNLLDKAIELDPNYAPAYASIPLAALSQNLAGELDRSKAAEKAHKAVKKLEKLAPDQAMTLTAKALTIRNFNRNEEKATNLLKKAIELDPNYSEAHRELGWSYYSQGMYEVALEHAELAQKANPQSLLPGYLLGQIHRKLGNYDKALKAYQSVIGENINDLFEQNGVIYTYLLMDEYDKAETAARQQLEKYPNIYSAKMYSAYALVMNKKFDESIKLMQEIKFDRGIYFAYAFSGDKEKTYKRINELQKGKNRDTWQTARNIGELYAGLGEKDKAIEALSDAVTKRKEDTKEHELRNFGWSLANDPEYKTLRDDPTFQTIIAETGYKN